MQYRLLAVDMDDTLLGEDLQIRPRTVEKIQLAREAGVEVMIASGRMFRAIMPYIRQLGLTGPAISYNGALVQRWNAEQAEVHHPVPLKLARAVAQLVEESGSQLNAYIDDWLYVRKRTPQVLEYMQKTGVDSTEVGSIAEFLQAEPTKLLVIHDQLDEIEEIQNQLVNRFGNDLNIAKSKPNYIEITAKGVTKGMALAEVAAQLGFQREEVIAIGDGQNDLEMLRWAGLGVAMANATNEVKASANYVTASCEEEGVAQVIDEFILKRG